MKNQTCPTCGKNYTMRQLESTDKCCGLFCPGLVPHKFAENIKHVEFLQFVDRLKWHPMFRNHFNNRRWRVEPDNCYTIISKVNTDYED